MNQNLNLDQQNILKLRNILRDLPPLCSEFIRGIEHNTSILTRINYGYDLRLFFEYLLNNISEFKDIKCNEITYEHLDRITPLHIEMFLEYISFYRKDDDSESSKVYENSEAGKARKLSTLRSFFAHFYKKGHIIRNTAELIDLPRIHEKAIVRLEVDEVARLLDLVESGQGLTKRQKQFHDLTKTRDLAMIMLFLGTGIRISECVRLNIKDFDFNINGFKITRKGGSQVVLYFSDEVRKALLNYLDERKKIEPVEGHEEAFFLSIQRKRISNRAVQNLVKKYAKIISPLKKITPHKLRSTYGTTLYRETGDIYLVADVLGHKDVNTTRKHYAAISDDKRRMAAKVVKLRDD